MDIRNKRLNDEEFYKQRQEVLAQWPTRVRLSLLASNSFLEKSLHSGIAL